MCVIFLFFIFFYSEIWGLCLIEIPTSELELIKILDKTFSRILEIWVVQNFEFGLILELPFRN